MVIRKKYSRGYIFKGNKGTEVQAVSAKKGKKP